MANYKDGTSDDAHVRTEIRGRESSDPTAPGISKTVTTTDMPSTDKVYLDTNDKSLSDAYRTGPCTGGFIQTRNVWGPVNPAGADAFNYVVTHLMIGVAWTRFTIVQSSISDTEDLKFYNGNDLVKQIRITCQPSGSDTEIIIGDPEFILTEAGDFLLQETGGDKLILEV
jgi:hypothetical protein